jgi:hypothetical protein
MNINTRKFSFYTAFLTSGFALLTFIITATTAPISGPFCKSNCIGYPYTDIISRFPRDYYWMFFAIILLLLYLVLFVSLQQISSKENMLFAKIATVFAIISGTIIISCYFVQISVIQPSLINGETVGIALLTQYNPHGVFIALEEIGYIFMSISFLFASLIFLNKSRIENIIRWVFILGFVLTMAVFILIVSSLGIHREYIFEVAAITITWFTLIINGALLAIFLHQFALKPTLPIFG